MKAIETVQRALGLLGFAENDGNSQLTQRVMNRAVTLVNLVLPSNKWVPNVVTLFGIVTLVNPSFIIP